MLVRWHATKARIEHGWAVRALARDPATAAKPGAHAPIDWAKGDAMNRASVVAAAQGVQLIVHAANPPGYRNWKGIVAPMTDNAVAAARASGARLVIPGSVYNFAPHTGPGISEDAPQAPATRMGAIRLAAPFNETFREMLEMHYLWNKRIGLDNAKLVRFLGEKPHTPIDVALEATLVDMGLVRSCTTGDPGQALQLRSRSAPTR